MFTGIIEEIGKIIKIKQESNITVLEISADKILSNLQIGDSVSVNGICLTVSQIKKNSFVSDVMPVTFAKTTFRTSIPKFVNLERALTLKKPLGGHLVSGHIDGTGKIFRIDNTHSAKMLHLEIDSDLAVKMINEGSIAIDGISLTIAKEENNICVVSIIPHTFEHTNLKYRKVNDLVNIETDMIGKYVQKFLIKEKNNSHRKIDLDFLNKNGFI